MRVTRIATLFALAVAGAVGGGCQHQIHPDDMSAEAHREQAALLSEKDSESEDQVARHAQQHLAAAAYLEAFERSECKNLPRVTRAQCPLLGPIADITDIPHGVRVRFGAGVPVATVLAQMRCHFAYAQTRGFENISACPLYLRGIEIAHAPDPRAIDIVSRDARTTADIRSLARQSPAARPAPR